MSGYLFRASLFVYTEPGKEESVYSAIHEDFLKIPGVHETRPLLDKGLSITIVAEDEAGIRDYVHKITGLPGVLKAELSAEIQKCEF